LFCADSKEFIARHIDEGGFILKAVYNHEIVGFLIVRIPKFEEDNLGFDIHLEHSELEKVAHIESVGILPDHRGKGLQKQLMMEAENLLRKKGFTYLMATVHPKNLPSLNNFIKSGYEIVKTVKKYGGMERHVLLKENKNRDEEKNNEKEKNKL
jgi:ribosomal protein S18 acetylase RimI-like enzyme